MTRDLGDGACHFHAGWAAADDREGEQTPLLGLVVGDLGTLEREEDSPARARRVVEALQARRRRRPFIVPEIEWVGPVAMTR